MKKIIILVITILILFVASIYTGDELQKDTYIYDLETVESINISLDEADINIITADIDKIQVEISSNLKTQEDETYFCYIENNSLYIENYIKDEKSYINPKTKINIYIPVESYVNAINIDIAKGSISITDLSIDNINLSGEDIKININNSSVNDIKINTEFGNIKIKDTTVQYLNINSVKSKIVLEHIVCETANIDSTVKTSIDYINSVINYFYTSGVNLDINLTLYDSYDYVISTDKSLKNENFEYVDEVYRYDTDPQEDVLYFNFIDTDVNNINFTEKQ